MDNKRPATDSSEPDSVKRSRQENENIVEVAKLVDRANERADQASKRAEEAERIRAEEWKKLYTVTKEELDIANAKLAGANVDSVELIHELKVSETERLRLTRSLYARCLFEQFEEKLANSWRIAHPLKVFSEGRFLRWQAVLSSSKGRLYNHLKRELEARRLPLCRVPDIVVRMFDKLSEGVHKSYSTEHNVLLIDADHLDEEEVDLMKAICRTFPLRSNGYKVIKTRSID